MRDSSHKPRHDDLIDEEAVGLLFEHSLVEKRELGSMTIHKHLGRHPRFFRICWVFLRWAFSWMVRLCVELLPSFVAKRFFPRVPVTRLHAPKIHKTSWLDGLRGLAAGCVVACHWIGRAIGPAANVAYGAQKPGVGTNFWQLPGIRLLYGGTPHVCVFFVISGYALSIRPVQLAANGDTASAMQAYSSSIFRRFFRLYLPLWISTIGMWYYQYLNLDTTFGIGAQRRFVDWASWPKYVDKLQDPWYKIDRGFNDSSASLDAVEKRSFNAPLFMENVAKLLTANIKSTTIFEKGWSRAELANAYNPPTWTIPVEYRASLMLFLVQIGLARFKPRYRVLLTLVLILFSILVDRYEMILFLGGFLLAQLEPIITHCENLMELNTGTGAKNLRLIYKASMIVLFLFGVHMLSYPQGYPAQTPGYKWYAQHIPKTMTWMPYWFWLGNGAIITIFGISRVAWLRNFFSTPLLQYTGQISFSLYLVHMFVEPTLGAAWLYRVLQGTHNLDRHNWMLFEFGVATSLAFIYGCTIWFADVFTRFVDVPSVRFTKWLERKLLA